MESFINRDQAGDLLSRKVMQCLKDVWRFGKLETIVVGLPRGGMPVAFRVASALRAPLNILVSKKIGAPHQPELAIGAVSSFGNVVLNEEILRYFQIDKSYIQQEVDELTGKTQILENVWRQKAGLETPDYKGKRVIVVDDGVATGMTTLACLHALREQGAEQVILATPVISREANSKLRSACDLIVSLIIPVDLVAVGYYYQDFHQLEDSEVIEVLKQASQMTQANVINMN